MAYKHVPICTTKAQIAAYNYDFATFKGKYTPHPCRSMTNIDYGYKEFQSIDEPESGFPLSIEIAYPDQIKIIRQSKAVDIHVFIGNIGGYIGLFLGKTYNQSIATNYNCFKNSTRCNVPIIANYIFITGYAIIQIPDLLLFMYEKIKKIKSSLTLRSSNVIKIREENNADVFVSTISDSTITDPDIKIDVAILQNFVILRCY